MKLEGIQMGRAVAALMVLLYHCNDFFLPERLYAGLDGGRIFRMGYAGVEFFFVLSGFIMILVHRSDFDQPDRAAAFLRKRIVRIYPLLWIVLLGVLALNHVAGRASDPSAIAATFTLWPIRGDLVLVPAWTLQHEMLFYLLFMLVIINVRIGLSLLAIWMAGCLAAAFVGPFTYPFSFLFSPYNLLFPFGMLAGLVVKKVSKRDARQAFATGLLLFVAVGLSEAWGVEWNLGLRTICYGIGALGMVVGLANGVLPSCRPLTFLGDASYSIYLVHVPALAVTVAVFRKLGAPWSVPPLATLILVCGVVVAAATLVHTLVERRILDRLRMRSPRSAACEPIQGLSR